MYLEHLRDIVFLIAWRSFGWADISKSQDLFSGNVDPNKAVLRFSFEAFLRCFNFQRLTSGAISTPRLELPSPDKRFLRLSTYFTSLDFT